MMRSPRQTFGLQDFVYFSDNVRHWLCRSCDIVTLEAQGNHTRITLGEGTIALIRRPLGQCAGKLDPSAFFRIQRDCVVNLQAVKATQIVDRKRLLFVLLDGRKLTISRGASLLLRKQKGI